MDALKLAALQLGDLERLDALTADLERSQRMRDDLWFLQWTILESAFVPLARGRHEEALERLHTALDISHRIGDNDSEPLMHDALSWTHRARGAYGEALVAGRRAVALAGGLGDQAWRGWTAATLAHSLLDLRAADEAATVLEDGLRAAEHNHALDQTVRCVSLLAWARALLGDAAGAIALAERGESMLRSASLPVGGAFLFGAAAHVAVARVFLADDQPERAQQLLEPLLGAARVAGWREVVASAALALGQANLALGARGHGLALLQEAASLAHAASVPAPEWEARATLARLHRDAGRAAEESLEAQAARTIVQRMADSVGDAGLSRRFLAVALSESPAPAAR
jgi:tetratricopeptide (TPR) repeat protein